MITEGKWEVHDKMTETGSKLEIIPIYNCPKEGRMPNGTRCVCAVSGHDAEAYDNARLIAAAPELLEACKEAVVLFQKLGVKLLASGNISNIEELPEHKGDKHGNGSTVDKIQQAIAKAEGRE